MWVHIEMHTKPNVMQEEIIVGIYSAEEACMSIVGQRNELVDPLLCSRGALCSGGLFESYGCAIMPS